MGISFKRGTGIIFALIIMLLIVLSVDPALASSASATTDRTGDLIDLLYRIICFSLMIFILYKVMKKTNALGILSSRSKDIEERLTELKREKQEAEKRSLEMETQLRDFEARKKEIIDAYKGTPEDIRKSRLGTSISQIEKLRSKSIDVNE